MYSLEFVLKNEAGQANFNLNKRMLIQQPFLHWVYCAFSKVSPSAQETQVSDSRGAQHSTPNSSSSPYSSSVSSSSSRGVFGSSAMNDRTSALKAAFQVKHFKI